MSGDQKRIALSSQVGDNAAFICNGLFISDLPDQIANGLLDLFKLTGGAVNRDKLFKHIYAVFFVKFNHDHTLSAVISTLPAES